MNRRRSGRGGIAYTYTKEEEDQQLKKKALKNIIPLISELVIELHESESKKLKVGKDSTPVSNPKINKLTQLIESLKS